MDDRIIYYNPYLKKLASRLRRNSTPGEKRLWNILKKKHLNGYDFHRQKPIGQYIVDFYSPKLKLIIEIDGSTHDFRTEEDQVRQKYLESLGPQILRFMESDVRFRLENLVQAIKNWINEHKTLTDTPLPHQR